MHNKRYKRPRCGLDLNRFCVFRPVGYAQAAASDIHAAVDAQLHSNAQQHGITGQSVLVLHNSDVLYRNATGTTALEDGKFMSAIAVGRRGYLCSGENNGCY